MYVYLKKYLFVSLAILNHKGLLGSYYMPMSYWWLIFLSSMVTLGKGDYVSYGFLKSIFILKVCEFQDKRVFDKI